MKCAQALIHHHADVDAIDESGSTPLHHAVSVGNVEITVLLLDKGADAHIEDKDNLSPIEVIAETQTIAHKAIMVVLLRHYERTDIHLPRSVKLKLSIQSAEIAAAATGMAYTSTGVGMGDRNKSAQSLVSQGHEQSRQKPLSPPRTVYDQVMAGEAYEPEKSYKAIKMRAAEENQTNHHMQSQASLGRPPSSHSLNESFPRASRPGIKSPPRAGSPNGAGIPVFAIRHMNTTSSPPKSTGGGSHTDAKRSNSFVAAALSAVDTPMYARSMSASYDNTDYQEPGLTVGGRGVVEVHGKSRDISQFVKSHVSASSISAARLQGMGMGVPGSGSVKLGEGSIHSEPEVPMITQADVEPENSPLLQDFPATDFVPFLPQVNSALGDYNPSHLDVFIEVEHCCDCHYHNDMTLRHDPKKYIQVANNIIHGLVKAIASNNFAVRVFAMRSKISSQKRVGALEVTLSARIALPEVTDADLPRTNSLPPNRASMLITANATQGSSSHLTRSNSMASSSKDNTKKDGKGDKEKEKEVKEIVREKLNMPKPRWQSTVLFSKIHSKS